MVGQEELGRSILIAMMSNGHILLESVPGLAKTTAAKTLTEAVNGKFSRIQCTPDLMPSDIIGTQTLNMSNNTFETKLGPVYANFVLLDEVNRSSAKTQSAMLEAMAEHAVSIGGQTYDMPPVFVVIATQNPIEQEGTYVLSEAQMDRFLLKVELDYPSTTEECEILNRIEAGVFSQVKSVATINDILYLQGLTKRVYVDESIKKYIVQIVQATRETDGHDADAQTLKEEIDAFEEELKRKYKTEETEPEKDSKGAPDVQQGSSEEEQQGQRQREEDDKILNQILQDQNEGAKERFLKQNERNVQEDVFQYGDKNW